MTRANESGRDRARAASLEVADAVRRKMGERGLDAAGLCALLGWPHRNRLDRYLNGSRRIDIDVLGLIADALGCSLGELVDRPAERFSDKMPSRADAELEVVNWLARGRCFGRNAERIGEDAVHAADGERRLDLTSVEEFNARPHGAVRIGRRGSVWYESADVDAAAETAEAFHALSRRVRELEARLFAREVALGRAAGEGETVDEALGSLERLYAERAAPYWGWLPDDDGEWPRPSRPQVEIDLG